MPHPPITTIFSRFKMTTAGIVTPAGKGEGVYAVDGTHTCNSVGVAIS